MARLIWGEEKTTLGTLAGSSFRPLGVGGGKAQISLANKTKEGDSA